MLVRLRRYCDCTELSQFALNGGDDILAGCGRYGEKQPFLIIKSNEWCGFFIVSFQTVAYGLFCFIVSLDNRATTLVTDAFFFGGIAFDVINSLAI